MAAPRPASNGAFGVGLSATVNPRDIARVEKRLDQWQGKELAKRLDKALAAGARLIVLGLRGRAPRDTGGLQRSVKSRRIKTRGDEVASYTVMPSKRVPDRNTTALLTALLVHGTSRGVEANPFVDQTQREMEPSVTAFISERVRRLE